MPDHVHMVFGALENPAGETYSLPEIMQSIKSVSAHRINRRLARRGPLWQQESFDHIPRRGESVNARVEYIRQNPVRRELVRSPEDYPWLWANERHR